VCFLRAPPNLAIVGADIFAASRIFGRRKTTLLVGVFFSFLLRLGVKRANTTRLLVRTAYSGVRESAQRPREQFAYTTFFISKTINQTCSRNKIIYTRIILQYSIIQKQKLLLQRTKSYDYDERKSAKAYIDTFLYYLNHIKVG